MPLRKKKEVALPDRKTLAAISRGGSEIVVDADDSEPWYASSLEDVLSDLGSSPAGLSSGEGACRAARGPLGDAQIGAARTGAARRRPRAAGRTRGRNAKFPG